MERPAKTLVAAATAASAAAVLGERSVRRRRRAQQRFRLRPDRPLVGELRRVASSQLELAIDELEHPGRDKETAIHEARKAIKRSRAVVRLVRDDLDPAAYRYVTTRLRVAGQTLSAERDAAVMEELLRDFADADEAELSVVLARIAAQREGPVEGEAIQALHDASAPVPDWTASASTVVSGFRSRYRRGRRAFRAARADPTDEQLHEWRKRAKDLWYSSQLLRAADPKRLKRIERNADELSDLLGDDHDLAVLRGLADGCPGLTRAIDERRAPLQAKAFEIGARLYRPPPRKLAKRIRMGLRKRTVWGLGC
jgi:CHAD domain-containing protein